MSSGLVRIFDRHFQLTGEIDNYSSLILNRKWHTFGDFELDIAANKRNVDALQKHSILTVGNDNDRVAVITGRTQTQNKDGEFVKVWGVTLSGLVDRKITIPATGEYGDEFTGTPVGNIMRELVRRHCFQAGPRKVPFLVVEDDRGEGENIDFSSRLKFLSDELMTLSTSSGLGWTITANPGDAALIFKVLTGMDRTYGNLEGNSHAVFSPQYDNVDNLEFTDSYNNYRNIAIVGGQGEGVERTIIHTWQGESEPEGFDRWETFIDARDLDVADQLYERGKMRLDETPGEFSLRGETIANRNLTLGKDCDLGDLVTVLKPEWGIRWDTRITGVQETWDASGYKALTQFGNESPSLDVVLKNKLKNSESEAVK